MTNILKTGNQIGKGLSVFNTIFASILGVCCISSGIGAMSASTKLQDYEKAPGKITSVDSCSIMNKKDKQYTCINLHYEFTVNKKVIKGTQSSHMVSYILNEGDPVTVYYNPENPKENQLSGKPPVLYIGAGMVGFGICIMLSAIIIHYVVNNVKGAGTGYAATQVLSSLSS